MRAKVKFEIDIPCHATKRETYEWIAFNIGIGGICIDNPLADIDLDADWRSVEITFE